VLKTDGREKERKKKHSERLPNDPAYKYLSKSEKSVHNIKKVGKNCVLKINVALGDADDES
jgi:hypothetical protein